MTPEQQRGSILKGMQKERLEALNDLWKEGYGHILLVFTDVLSQGTPVAIMDMVGSYTPSRRETLSHRVQAQVEQLISSALRHDDDGVRRTATHVLMTVPRTLKPRLRHVPAVLRAARHEPNQGFRQRTLDLAGSVLTAALKGGTRYAPALKEAALEAGLLPIESDQLYEYLYNSTSAMQKDAFADLIRTAAQTNAERRADSLTPATPRDRRKRPTL